MAVEIERKFLVRGEGWKPHVAKTKRLVQAYLAREERTSVRIRIVDDASASLTIKSQGASISRHEFEYPIPLSDAQTLIGLRVGCLVSKCRHVVLHDGMVWEVDEFAA